jgi:hypothetical protein
LEKGKGCGWEEKGEGAGSDAEGGEESDEGRHFSGMRYEGVWLGLEIVCRVTVIWSIRLVSFITLESFYDVRAMLFLQ